MKEARTLWTVGLFCVALAACGGDGNGDARGEGPTTGAAGDGEGALGGAAGSGGNAGNETGSNPAHCVPGVPATSQIPRLLNRQYAAVVRDLLGISTLGRTDTPVAEFLVADSDGPMTPDAWRIYRDAAEQIASATMGGAGRERFIQCDPATAGCMDQTIRSFGRKAFRRPLTEAEVSRFLRLAQTNPAGSPQEVAEATLFAFLVSPSFLLLPELSTAADPSGSGIQLSSHEVATRLSFTLWGSLPDDTLNAAADADALATPAQLLAQAERMLAVREKAGPQVTAFHREWVQMNNESAHWWKTDHDPKTYPLYSASANTSWEAELEAFFEEVAFTGGSFEDLLLSNIAFVNRDTAAIYGMDPSPYGAELVKVELDGAERPGFMTRAGFLGSYAGYAATSPILRGAFISTYMLGVNPGPPLPGATMMTVAGDFATERAYVEELTRPAACVGCHSIINPLGFALENYGGIGEWQTVDPRGGAIDASVTTATVALGDGRSQEVTSPLQLMQAIATTPKTKLLYAQAWVAFAFGRAANANDRCLVDELDAKLGMDGYTIIDLIADLTQADSFRLRVQQNP